VTSSRAVPLDDRAAWEKALEGVPHAFAHTWQHCEAIALSSGHATYLWHARDAGETYACVVAEREYLDHVDVFTPYGFTGFVGSASSADLAGAWHRFVAEREYVCAYLVLNPVLSDPSYFADVAARHRTVYVLDLRLSGEELCARLSLNRKRELRLSGDADPIVRDQNALADFFVATYPEFMASRGAASVYDLTPESLRLLCESEDTLLVGAQRDGELCAAALFGFTRYLGDYLFGISNVYGRGVPFLNLGGGVVEGDGVAEFKRRFGADEMPLMSVKEIYLRDVYRQLCERADVDPDDGRYFPAYRRPRAT
jgi:hypothetical protein